MSVKKSGSIVNGPRPEPRKPVKSWMIGLEVMAYRIRAIVRKIKPRLNLERVL
jgi:hypothetical protein